MTTCSSHECCANSWKHDFNDKYTTACHVPQVAVAAVFEITAREPCQIRLRTLSSEGMRETWVKKPAVSHLTSELYNTYMAAKRSFERLTPLAIPRIAARYLDSLKSTRLRH